MVLTLCLDTNPPSTVCAAYSLRQQPVNFQLWQPASHYGALEPVLYTDSGDVDVLWCPAVSLEHLQVLLEVLQVIFSIPAINVKVKSFFFPICKIWASVQSLTDGFFCNCHLRIPKRNGIHSQHCASGEATGLEVGRAQPTETLASRFSSFLTSFLPLSAIAWEVVQEISIPAFQEQNSDPVFSYLGAAEYLHTHNKVFYYTLTSGSQKSWAEYRVFMLFF